MPVSREIPASKIRPNVLGTWQSEPCTICGRNRCGLHDDTVPPLQNMAQVDPKTGHVFTARHVASGDQGLLLHPQQKSRNAGYGQTASRQRASSQMQWRSEEMSTPSRGEAGHGSAVRHRCVCAHVCRTPYYPIRWQRQRRIVSDCVRGCDLQRPSFLGARQPP